MEPETGPLEKNNHRLLSPNFLVQYYIFGDAQKAAC